MRHLLACLLSLGLLWASACAEPAPTSPSDGGSGPDASVSPDASPGLDASPGPDASSLDACLCGPPDAATEADAGTLPEAQEQEPNNGAAASDVNSLALATRLTGALGTGGDLDIFTVNLTAGDFLVWELTPPAGSSLRPHLAIAEHANKVPALVVAAPASGQPVVQHHLVLSSGRYNVIVRDARNVGSSPAGVGGPDYRYTLTVQSRPPVIVPVTFPSKRAGGLPAVSHQALYSFTVASSSFAFDAEVIAARLTPPSDLDSRLSLFDVTRKTWVITNDDPALGQKDSKLGGQLQPGDYLLVLENVNPAAQTLNYDLDLTLR